MSVVCLTLLQDFVTSKAGEGGGREGREGRPRGHRCEAAGRGVRRVLAHLVKPKELISPVDCWPLRRSPPPFPPARGGVMALGAHGRVRALQRELGGLDV